MLDSSGGESREVRCVGKRSCVLQRVEDEKTLTTTAIVCACEGWNGSKDEHGNRAAVSTCPALIGSNSESSDEPCGSAYPTRSLVICAVLVPLAILSQRKARIATT